MGLFKGREGQVQKMLAARRAADKGRGSKDDLPELMRESTGHEINEAMDRSGQGTGSWARIER